MQSYTMIFVAIAMVFSVSLMNLKTTTATSINCSPNMMQEPVNPTLRKICSLFEQVVFDDAIAPVQQGSYMEDMSRNPISKKRAGMDHNFLRIGRNFAL